VRLEDVDGVEVDLAFVLFGELVEGGNLPPEWRSSIGAENEDDRAVLPEGRHVYGGVFL